MAEAPKRQKVVVEEDPDIGVLSRVNDPVILKKLLQDQVHCIGAIDCGRGGDWTECESCGIYYYGDEDEYFEVAYFCYECDTQYCGQSYCTGKRALLYPGDNELTACVDCVETYRTRKALEEKRLKLL